MAAKSKKGGARKGAGRKPKPAREKQSRHVGVSFTEGEHQALEDAADGKPVSTFLRTLALRFLARCKK